MWRTCAFCDTSVRGLWGALPSAATEPKAGVQSAVEPRTEGTADPRHHQPAGEASRSVRDGRVSEANVQMSRNATLVGDNGLVQADNYLSLKGLSQYSGLS